ISRALPRTPTARASRCSRSCRCAPGTSSSRCRKPLRRRSCRRDPPRCRARASRRQRLLSSSWGGDMFIQRLEAEKQVLAYNTLCQVLYPWEGVVTPPFGAAWAIVKPGESTKHHGHQEGETFFFVKGQGVMRIGDETHEIRPGDVCFQPPFNKHILTNTSESEDLLFLTIWWQDLKL